MHLTLAAWLAGGPEVRRYLIRDVRLPVGTADAKVAYDKVARTPADAPIVGAVAWREGGAQPYTSLALCGAAPIPLRQTGTAQIFDATGDIEAALVELELDPVGDHWGSREYRSEMARVLARRVLTAVGVE
jgi:CO/xanthine dehydrogenase FAD-binding subunit